MSPLCQIIFIMFIKSEYKSKLGPLVVFILSYKVIPLKTYSQLKIKLKVPFLALKNYFKERSYGRDGQLIKRFSINRKEVIG